MAILPGMCCCRRVRVVLNERDGEAAFVARRRWSQNGYENVLRIQRVTEVASVNGGAMSTWGQIMCIRPLRGGF